MTPDDADPLGRVHEPVTGAEPTAEEAAQSELDLGMVSTGSTEVDQALQPLEGLAERPVGDHARIFEQVLGGLAETMTASDVTPGATPGEPPATD